MKIIIQINENPILGCDAEEHFNLHFDKSGYEANGVEIVTVFTRKFNAKDSMTVITPNGDQRELYSYNLDALHNLLQQLSGIKV